MQGSAALGSFMNKTPLYIQYLAEHLLFSGTPNTSPLSG